MGASASILPAFRKASINFSTAALPSVFSSFVNSFTSSPATFANFAGFAYSAVITFCNAVAPFSTFTMFWSSTEPKAITSACVIPACLPTPANLLVNSIKYPSLALELCANSLITEPVDNIACFKPIRSASPNICANLPMFFTASSPKSSPRATFIWSAASTKSSTASLL